MKKHIIAAAVAAAFAVPAVAQVTVSGAFDIQANNSNKRSVVSDNSATVGFATTTTAANTSTKNTGTGGSTGTSWGGWSDSQLVFTATEDLGNGLKATGVFNQRLGNDGNFGGARDKYLQLDTGFGNIRIGRFAPAVSNFGGYGNNGTTNTAGHSLGFFSGGTTDTGAEFFVNAAGAGDFHRQNGVVQFTSPSFNGIVATLGLAKSDFDKSAETGSGKVEQTGVTVNYTAGPLSVGVGSATRKLEVEAVTEVALVAGTGATAVVPHVPSVANATRKSDIKWLGASYKLGAASLSAAYSEREDNAGNVGAEQVRRIDAKLSTIAITYPVGAITLIGSSYDGKDNRQASATDDSSMKGYQMSVHYALSKRTVAYFVTGENKLSSASGPDQRKTTETNIGLRHSF